MKHEDPAGGFAAFATPPRFSDAYAAARNRLGILVETHSWKDYATRVRATHDALVAVLRELSAHGAEWQRVGHEADAESLAGKTLTLSWEPDDDEAAHHRLPRLPLHALAVADLDGDAHRVRHDQARGLARPALRHASAPASR